MHRVSSDDDLSEPSSGHETAASGSSRQGLDVDDGAKKKKKTKGKKKEKKGKGKKKADEPAEDSEKKTKRRGFGLLRYVETCFIPLIPIGVAFEIHCELWSVKVTLGCRFAADKLVKVAPTEVAAP